MASMQALLESVMANPDVAAVGIVVGFILKWAMNKRKRGMGGMGGGGMFG